MRSNATWLFIVIGVPALMLSTIILAGCYDIGRNLSVMCVIQGQPSAIVHDLRHVRIESGTVVSVALDGTRSGYRMIPGEACYIVNMEDLR